MTINALFITSTDTGVGKTYFSSFLISQLTSQKIFSAKQIAYYKPIQCGLEIRDGKPKTDCDYISENNPEVEVFNSYFLGYPAAPNFAASLEGIAIDIEKIKNDFADLKKRFDFVIIEGAGGLAVPISDEFLISDLAHYLNLPLVLVIRADLGTINHSLLSIEHARNKDLEILGIHVSAPNPNNNASYSGTNEKTNELQKKAAIDSILKIGSVNLFDITSLFAKSHLRRYARPSENPH